MGSSALSSTFCSQRITVVTCMSPFAPDVLHANDARNVEHE